MLRLTSMPKILRAPAAMRSDLSMCLKNSCVSDALSVLIYLVINAILYFIVGMGVVWCIREFKDGSDDGKLTIGIGVVVQIVLSNVVSGIVSAIF